LKAVFPSLRATVIALSIASASTALAGALDADPTEQAFVSRYRCGIVRTLETIHSTPEPQEETDRFLILYRKDHQASYVQCAFFGSDAELHCEAASGFYDHVGEPRSHFVTGDRLAALGRLGFSLDDSHDNYLRIFQIRTSPDFTEIADFLLSALNEGYGGPTQIGVEAPLANGAPIDSRCAPVS
jgi:hypothetical protein